MKSINYYINLFLETFKFFGRVKAWTFLLCILSINWLILYSHYQFTDPLFYGVVHWWTELWDSQFAGGFTHYPGHYTLLSYYYNNARWFVSLVVEGSLLGAAAVIFYRYLYQESERPTLSFNEKIKLWMHLTLGWSFINSVLFVGYKYLPQVFESILWSSPRRQMLFDYGVIPIFNILVVALFYFTIPYIAIYRTTAIEGLKSSVKLFFSRPILILILSGTILIVPIIISLLLANPAALVEKFNPILIYWFLVVGIVVDLFVNFFWMGTAVNFLSDEESSN